MNALQKIEEIKEELGQFREWESKYAHIIKMGKQLEDIGDEHRIDANLVKGCQSKVWLYAQLEKRDEQVVMKLSADSDASIVKGIIALLLKVYDELAPEEALDLDTGFIDEIGLRQHLSMSRANGLNSMLKQIKLYALAYKTKLSMGQPGSLN